MVEGTQAKSNHLVSLLNITDELITLEVLQTTSHHLVSLLKNTDEHIIVELSQKEVPAIPGLQP